MSVNVPVGENSYTVQEQLGYICQQTLPQVLERVCNALCLEAYWIKLNTVSLNIGTLPATELERAISESVAEKFAEALMTAIGEKTSYLNDTGVQEHVFGSTVEQSGYDSSIATWPEEGEIQLQKNSPTSAVEVLKYFLSTGVLPSWIDGGSVIVAKLFDKAITTSPGEIRHFLLYAPDKNKLCKRLAGIVRKKQLKALAIAITQTNAFDGSIDVLLTPESVGSTSDRVNPLKIKESLLSYLLHHGYRPFKAPGIKKKNPDNSLAGQWNTPEIHIMERIRRGELFKGDSFRETPLQQAEAPVHIRTEDGETPVANDSVETNDEQLGKNDHKLLSAHEVQPCTVYNAGLVILWPGIPSLLDNCALTRNGSFISEAAAERAVLLLQYAVDGRTEIPEFELPLPKLLCGLTTDTPVTTVFEPTATEKAAVRELLQNVIAEWGALKGSSPEALQVNYLQREGSLTPKGDHWQLEVERQTADVLLDQLPWGIGVVKLPWMHQIVYTAW